MPRFSAAKIGVLKTRAVKGITRVSDTVPPVNVISEGDAFHNKFNTDAHLLCYKAINTGSNSYPRIRKIALPEIRKHGADVVTTWMVFDYDNPNHSDWNSRLLDEFVATVSKGMEKDPLLDQWRYFYTTSHGARFVYLLDKPISPEKHESYYLILCERFRKVGVPVDTKCVDWTRLFRLPSVLRDGVCTWENQFFVLEQQIKKLDLSQYKDDLAAPIIVEAKPLNLDIPSKEDAQKPLYKVQDDGSLKGTALLASIQRRLLNRDSYNALFNYKTLAEPGNRTDTILKYVGQVIGMTRDLKLVTPQVVYGLFYDPVDGLDPDEGTPDWHDFTWGVICNLWSRQLAQEEQKQKELEHKRQLDAITVDDVAAKMAEWATDIPELQGSPNDRAGFVSQNAIACLRNEYYLLGTDGRFVSNGVTKEQIPMMVRNQGVDAVIPTHFQSGESVRRKTATDMVSDHGFPVARVIGSVNEKLHGTVSDFNGEGALNKCLYNLRTDLEPEYDEEVDQLLTHMAGSRVEALNNWLGLALDLKRPLCALAIVSPPGCGKGLLIRGLAECINTESIATPSSFGQFNEGLLNSPFLCVDEGFPKQPSGSRTADLFRHYIAGDTIEINGKYKSPVFINVPVRIILTANNESIFEDLLTSGRNLSLEDRNALAQRIFYIRAQEKAAWWLAHKGGRRFTGSPGRRWVQGAGGEQSDYILAKHLLYLYTQRQVTGTRFAMEGTIEEQPEVFNMQYGQAPDILRVLIDLIRDEPAVKNYYIVGPYLYVTAGAVLDWYDRKYSEKRQRSLQAKYVSESLRQLGDGSVNPHPYTIRLEDGTESKKGRYHKLQVGNILHTGMDIGICTLGKKEEERALRDLRKI